MSDLLEEIAACTNNAQLRELKQRVGDLNKQATVTSQTYERRKLYDRIRAANKAIEEADNRINTEYFRFEGAPEPPVTINTKSAVQERKPHNVSSSPVSNIQHRELDLDSVLGTGHANIQNVEFSTLSNSQVQPGSIRLLDIKKSTLTLHTKGPIMAREVSDSTFQVECHQLRLHAVIDTRVFVAPSCAVVMEGCKGVTIGVFEEGRVRGVSESERRAMRVFDFSWPGGGTNPNFGFLSA